jgi:glucose/arabinose dehydrogenase
MFATSATKIFGTQSAQSADPEFTETNRCIARETNRPPRSLLLPLGRGSVPSVTKSWRPFVAMFIALVARGRGAPAVTPRVEHTHTTAEAFGGVKFKEPVQVLFAPGEKHRAFVVERGGMVVVVRDLAQPKREVFLDLGARGRTFDRDHGTLTMAFHPRFAENGFFYLWFSTQVGRERANRLARFTAFGREPLVADVKSELPLLTQPTGPHGHDGAMLLFGPDGYLYLSLGDGDEHYPEPQRSRQSIERSFFGGVLRLDVDRRAGSLAPNAHPAVHAGAYAVPADNPFVGATHFNGAGVVLARVRTEFWCVGLRNPWRMAFDPVTGFLWCGDVGLKAREEVDILVRGGNYGWNFREGSLAGTRGRAPAEARFVEPVWDYPPAQGLSVTGGLVYRGHAYPELVGKYLFADYVTARLWALEPDGDRPVGVERVREIGQAPTIVAFALDPRNDEVLLTSFGAGKILRLVRKP